MGSRFPSPGLEIGKGGAAIAAAVAVVRLPPHLDKWWQIISCSPLPVEGGRGRVSDLRDIATSAW